MALPSLVSRFTLLGLLAGVAPVAIACSSAERSAVGQAAEEIGDAPDASSPSAIDWPTPAGWEHETIPFPLFFAPDVGYAGVAEVRFTPNCFEEAVPNYFSYSFAWILDGDYPAGAAQLDKALEAYYRGLAKTFDAAHFDEAAHKATIYSRSGWFVGEVKTVDPFNDSRPLTLSVEGTFSTLCNGHRVVEFSVQPTQGDSATAVLLRNQLRTLRCAPGG
jgi:hypothetical protein